LILNIDISDFTATIPINSFEDQILDVSNNDVKINIKLNPMNFLINVHHLVDDLTFKEYCTNVQKADYDFLRDVLELYYYSRNEYSEVYSPDQFLSLSHKLIPLFRTSLQGAISYILLYYSNISPPPLPDIDNEPLPRHKGINVNSVIPDLQTRLINGLPQIVSPCFRPDISSEPAVTHGLNFPKINMIDDFLNEQVDTLDLNGLKFVKPPRDHGPNLFSQENIAYIDILHRISSQVDRHILPAHIQRFNEKAEELIITKTREKNVKKQKKMIKIPETPQNELFEPDLNHLEVNSKTHFLMFNLQIQGRLYPSLIDSGASHSIINYDIIKDLSIPIRQEKFIVNTCTGSSNNNVVGTAKLPFILIDTLDQPYIF